jgi:ketosteroid isomerase-like protein
MTSRVGDDTRAAIERHWWASEHGDIDAEHAIYAADAILDYPQSGERFRGRDAIAAQRGGHPAERHFTVLRILGEAQIWTSECVNHLRRGPGLLGIDHAVRWKERHP